MANFRDDCEFIYSQGFASGQALTLGILSASGEKTYITWHYNEGLAPLLSCWKGDRYFSVSSFKPGEVLLQATTVYAPWYA